MASKVRAKGYEGDEGASKTECGHPQVFNPHHDVIFLIGICVLADKVGSMEIAFYLFQFDHYDLTLRSRASEVLFRQKAAGGNISQEGTVAIGVYGGHQVQGVVGGKGLVDSLPGKFSAIRDTTGFIIGRHVRRNDILSCGDALILQSGDSGGAVLIAEQRVGMINADIHDTYQGSAPPVSRGRRGKGGKYVGGLHAGTIQEGRKPGYSIVAVSGQGNGGYSIQRSVGDIIFIIRIVRTGNIGRIVDYLLLAPNSVYETNNILAGGIKQAVCYGTPQAGCLLQYTFEFRNLSLDGGMKP